MTDFVQCDRKLQDPLTGKKFAKDAKYRDTVKVNIRVSPRSYGKGLGNYKVLTLGFYSIDKFDQFILVQD